MILQHQGKKEESREVEINNVLKMDTDYWYSYVLLVTLSFSFILNENLLHTISILGLIVFFFLFPHYYQ